MGAGVIALNLLSASKLLLAGGAARLHGRVVAGEQGGLQWCLGGAQCAGLILYTLAEAVIFLPLIMIAAITSVSIIGKAGVVTGFMVLGLTAIAFTTKKDFTFLGGALKVVGLVALGVIVAGVFMPA